MTRFHLSFLVLFTAIVGLAHDADAADGKANTAIEFVNVVSSEVFRAADDYFKEAPPDKGPSCGTPNTLGHLQIPRGFDDRVKGLRSAAASKPADKELDAAARELADAYDQVATTLDAIVDYHREAYRADGCKKGKELHAKLRESIDRYAKADHAVRGRLAAAELARSQKELVTLEKKYGKKLHYYQLRTIVDAKLALAAVKDASDPESSSAAVAAYEATVKELADLEQKNHVRADQVGYSKFAQEAATFLDAVKAATKRKSDVEAMVNEYNELVTRYNLVELSAQMK